MSSGISRYAHGRCQLHVDGCGVPYVDIYEHEDWALRDGPRFSLTITRVGGAPLLGFDVDTEEELLRWAPFLANAMAVAAGRTSHGEHSRPANPHGANWFFEKDQSPVGHPVSEVQALAKALDQNGYGTSNAEKDAVHVLSDFKALRDYGDFGGESESG